ncbi:MAG: methylenetetrahydrofolate reductase [Thermoproteota archaeon]
MRGTPFSNLMKEIAAGKFIYTAELGPRKTTDISDIVKLAEAFKCINKVTAVNVTDNPRSMACISSLVASYIVQRETGLEAIYQLRAADRNRLALTSDILGAAALGLRNILAITGDHPMLGDNPQAKPVFDLDGTQLIALIHSMVYEGKDLAGNAILNPPKINVGAVGNPGADILEMEVLKLERKVDAGVEFIQTQVVFDAEVALKFLDAVKGLNIPVLIGIFPLKSHAQAKFFIEHVPGVRIPEKFLAELKKVLEIQDKKLRREKVNEYNANYFGEFIKEVRKNPACKGCHIMGVDRPEVLELIVERAEA